MQKPVTPLDQPSCHIRKPLCDSLWHIKSWLNIHISCIHPSYIMWPPLICHVTIATSPLQRTHIYQSSSSSSPHHGNLADGPNPGPLKAKERSSLKLSREDLLESDRPTGLARASTMEDIHTPITPTSRSQSEWVSLDAVRKLYISDHAHKYVDMSPVREKGGRVNIYV